MKETRKEARVKKGQRNEKNKKWGNEKGSKK